MQKLITLENGQEILLDGNLTWTMEYQNQFGHDIVPDLMPALRAAFELITAIFRDRTEINNAQEVIAALGNGNAQDALIELSGLQATDMIHIIWALAKCADEDIAPPRQWIRQFDVFPLDKIIPEAFGLIVDSSVSLKNSTSLREGMKSAQAKIAESTKA